MTVIVSPEPGQQWSSIAGRERVRIGRVWPICGCGRPVMHRYDIEHNAEPVDAVRCHPLHGGKWWWTTVPEFVARFELMP